MELLRKLIKNKYNLYSLEELNDILDEQKKKSDNEKATLNNANKGLKLYYEEKLEEQRNAFLIDIDDLQNHIEELNRKAKDLLTEKEQLEQKLNCNDEYYADLIKSQNDMLNKRFNEANSQLSVLKTKLMFLKHKGKEINYNTILKEIDKLIEHSKII